MLQIKGIVHKLDKQKDVALLREFHLELAARETVTLLVAPGDEEAKQALIEILTTKKKPEAGAVLFSGQDQLKLPPRKRAMVPVSGEPAMKPGQKSLPILISILKEEGMGKQEAAVRADELLECCGLKIKPEAKVAALNGEERLRLSVACALARNPGGLLLDEPLSGVHPSMARKLGEWLTSLLKDKGLPALWFTKDMWEAMRFGHRSGVLLRGRIEQVGAPEELYYHPASAELARLLGPVNIFTPLVKRLEKPAELELDGLVLRAPESKALVENERVMLMLRPECLKPISGKSREFDNQFSAEVLEVHREGPLTRVKVLLDNAVRAEAALLSEPDQPLGVGDRLRLGWHLDDACILPR